MMGINSFVQHYVIGIYIRLSKEDEDVSAESGKTESNSITNQRMLINDFIKEKPEFQNATIIEKCDDGYSGKKFDRPAFMELIEMARSGEINCIIVKDLSRFGRDYVEIGDYLEQIFPFLGVRFISINDHYDSAVNGNQTLGLDVVFKNFIYDSYSRDTSRKIREVRRKLAKEGSFASPNAPYGYLKSKEDKHKLNINPDTAPIVKRIYELKLSGSKATDIARILNAEGVSSPAQYAIDKGIGMDWRRINEKTGWTDSHILCILRDERYVGHMISLKRTLDGVYGKDTKVNKEEWIKVKDTHEGIVSQEVYDKVQELITNFEKPFTKRSTNVFTCGHCGRKMSKSKNKSFYMCRYGDVNPHASCYKFKVEAEALENMVVEELQQHFQVFLAEAEIQKKQDKKRVPVAENRGLYEKNLKLMEVAKTSLYEKYKEGTLTRDDYIREKKECDKKIREYQELLQENIYEDKVLNDKKSQVTDLIQKYRCEEMLTQEIKECFIDRVIVYAPNRICINWKFEDMCKIQ